MPKQATPLVFAHLPTGCFVPTSHKLNADGYFRKAWGNARSGDRIAEMFHRFIWRAHHGEIPEGYEIDHLCKNRACCNVKHLQCIPGDRHARESNATRYAARKAAAREWWERTGCTGTALGAKFGVSFSAGCEWIREWRT